MAPSSYYDTKTRPPSQRACRDGVLGPALVKLWEDNYRVYGARKLWKAARRAGHGVGRDQVARLMRAAGIEGTRRGKRVKTTKSDPAASRHPDLVNRKFAAATPKPPSDPLAEALGIIDPDALTPREALEALYRLKSLSHPARDD